MIYINSDHYLFGNTYQVTFPQPLNLDENSSISLQSFSAFNSTYNVAATLSNNTFSITWIDGNSKQFVIPDSYFSVDDMSTFIENCLLQQGWYATSNSGAAITYFISCQVNAPQYSNQINIFSVPNATTAAAKGLSPSGKNGFTAFPSNATVPQITFNPSLAQKFFGFKTQTVFPASTAVAQNYSFVSDQCPIISPSFNIIISCSILPPSNVLLPVLAQFPINAAFGNLINYNAVFPAQLTVKKSVYQQLTIQLWDQSMRPLQFRDNELSMSIVLETS